MNTKFQTYHDFLESKKTLLKVFKDEREELWQSFSISSLKVSDLKEAKEIMSIVGILAQQQVKEVVEGLMSQALITVFGEGYSFELIDQISRNKPEVTMFVVENECRRSLKDQETCGTIIDVVSLVLRIVLWSITSPRTRNTLILDEPLKSVSKDRLPFLQKMLKQLSNMLNLQIILVTHDYGLAEGSDRIFVVKKTDEISEVALREFLELSYLLEKSNENSLAQ